MLPVSHARVLPFPWAGPGRPAGGDTIRPEIALVHDHLALHGMIGPVLIALAGEPLMSLELMEK